MDLLRSLAAQLVFVSCGGDGTHFCTHDGGIPGVIPRAALLMPCQAFGEWDHIVDFVVTHDSFATHRVLVPRGNRFLFSERYLSVAQVRGAGGRD
jgi:transketolase C-terminal domain/subunit